jgi:hypothetical protein
MADAASMAGFEVEGKQDSKLVQILNIGTHISTQVARTIVEPL